ncbi:DNA-directed RNA polymerase II subunit RPB11, partial [Lecanoromycetidae sp. Uapishka_2]
MANAPDSTSDYLPKFSSRRSAPSADDNRPDRFELFLLGDGEKKVTEEADTRIQSSSIFTFKKEDHTLGNMLRSRLLQSPHVSFAGYKVPHPLVSEFILRIQTDGTLTPKAALQEACTGLVTDLATLSREFTKEWELKKMVGEGPKADEKTGDKDKGLGR